MRHKTRTETNVSEDQAPTTETLGGLPWQIKLLSPSSQSTGSAPIRWSGGNDLLEIQLVSGKTVLVPFVEAIVPEVQLDEGWLLLTPPPGLLEL